MADASELPTYRPTPKGTSPRPTTARSPSDEKGLRAQASMSPSNGRRNESCLSAPGPVEDRDLGPIASYYVLAAANPLEITKDQGSSTPRSKWNLLASLGLSTPRSKENLLARLSQAAPEDPSTQSLTTPCSAAHSCLGRSLTTHRMGSNASVAQLSHPRLHPPHRCALHVSFV